MIYHFIRGSHTEGDLSSACGTESEKSYYTRDLSKVTCKRCLKKLPESKVQEEK